jgi:prevent-host-death family protein
MNGVVIHIHDAQSQLSELVARACAGEEIVISLDGKSAVRLVAIPPEQPQKRQTSDRARRKKSHYSQQFLRSTARWILGFQLSEL